MLVLRSLSHLVMGWCCSLSEGVVLSQLNPSGNVPIEQVCSKSCQVDKEDEPCNEHFAYFT